MKTSPGTGRKWLRWVIVVSLTIGGTGVALWGSLISQANPGLQPRSNQDRAKAEGCLLLVALESYQADNGTYPMGGDAVVCQELAGRGVNTKIYCQWDERVQKSDGRFLDPWGTPYRFRNDGETVMVESAGEDRKFANGKAGDDLVMSSGTW